jgi:hypothetical protein
MKSARIEAKKIEITTSLSKLPCWVREIFKRAVNGDCKAALQVARFYLGNLGSNVQSSLSRCMAWSRAAFRMGNRDAPNFTTFVKIFMGLPYTTAEIEQAADDCEGLKTDVFAFLSCALHKCFIFRTLEALETALLEYDTEEYPEVMFYFHLKSEQNEERRRKFLSEIGFNQSYLKNLSRSRVLTQKRKTSISSS